jgi:hypothetical protein
MKFKQYLAEAKLKAKKDSSTVIGQIHKLEKKKKKDTVPNIKAPKSQHKKSHVEDIQSQINDINKQINALKKQKDIKPNVKDAQIQELSDRLIMLQNLLNVSDSEKK